MNVALHLAIHAATAEKHILEHLRQCGAVTARSAIEFSPADSMEESQLKALIRLGAVVRTKDNFYYLDEEALAAGKGRNQQAVRRLGWVLVVLLVISTVMALVLS